MASVSLTTIRETVRTRGDYPRSAKFTDAYVNGEIQAAWSELYELVADLNEGYWDTSATVSTVSSQPYAALPADCWRVAGIDRLDGSDYVALDQVGIADRNRFGSTTSSPTAYRLSARGADLYPTPNGVYTLRVSYTPIVTPLSDATTIQLFNDWQEYVVYGALLRMHIREERSINETSAALGHCKERITRGASRRAEQEPKYLPLFDVTDVMPPGWEPY